MYGSVAFWAWEEAALHMNSTQPGVVNIERFSKHTQLVPLSLTVGDTSAGWEPKVGIGVVGKTEILDLLGDYSGGASLAEIMKLTGTKKDATLRDLNVLTAQGKVEEQPAPAVPGKRGRRGSVWVRVE
jgi:hypothetical protein